jgi:hypothetical protein
MYQRAITGELAAENLSRLPQCGSSKRLQLRQQNLKSKDMAASEDGGCAAVAEALRRKNSEQEGSIRSIVGRRQEKIAAGARRKHVGWRQEKMAAGARRKLALSSACTSMVLGSKLRGGGWYSNRGATLIPPLQAGWKGRGAPCSASPAQQWRGQSPLVCWKDLHPLESGMSLLAGY